MDEIGTIVDYKSDIVIYFIFLAFSFYDIMLMNEHLNGFSFRNFCAYMCAKNNTCKHNTQSFAVVTVRSDTQCSAFTLFLTC
jgi:hypothetical protein